MSVPSNDKEISCILEDPSKYQKDKMTTIFDEYISQNPEKWALNEDWLSANIQNHVSSVIKPSSGEKS